MNYLQIWAAASETEVHVMTSPDGDVIIEMEREEDGCHARFSPEQWAQIKGFDASAA